MAGEHHFNPAALAKANGPATQQTQVIDIGRGTGLVGFEIRPMIDADGIAHAMLISGRILRNKYQIGLRDVISQRQSPTPRPLFQRHGSIAIAHEVNHSTRLSLNMP